MGVPEREPRAKINVVGRLKHPARAPRARFAAGVCYQPAHKEICCEVFSHGAQNSGTSGRAASWTQCFFRRGSLAPPRGAEVDPQTVSPGGYSIPQATKRSGQPLLEAIWRRPAASRRKV